jgi:hypothetical protein
MLLYFAVFQLVSSFKFLYEKFRCLPFSLFWKAKKITKESRKKKRGRKTERRAVVSTEHVGLFIH